MLSVATVLASVAAVAFPLSGILLAIFERARSDVAFAADRGSMRLLWIVIGLSVVVANLVQGVRIGRLPGSMAVVSSVAFALILVGLIIRWIRS